MQNIDDSDIAKKHAIKIERELLNLIEHEKIESKKIQELEETITLLNEKIKQKSRDNNEFNQQKILLQDIAETLQSKTQELDKIKNQIQEKVHRKNQIIKELEQQKIILLENNELLEEKLKKILKSERQLKEEIQQKTMVENEHVQQKIFQEEVNNDQKLKISKINKKYYLSICMFGVVLSGIMIPYSMYVTSSSGEEFRIENVDGMTSGYIIQNLKGDTIDTWLSWRLVEGDTLHVNIVNGEKYPEQVEIIKEVILSKEAIEIDDSLLHKGPEGTSSIYYIGWAGALEQTPQTELYVPTKFSVSESANGAGDITIRLTPNSSGDGFSGWTKSIADESQNQILKSDITIYDIDTISPQQLETIMRHEFGHALGLAHSTAPEDLMHPKIKTDFPYVSECNIDAMTLLYDGGKTSQVVCEK